jgi:hypothetical protein
MNKLIFLSIIFLTFISCATKVYITKTYDSLPCVANVEYPDYGKTRSASINGNWAFTQKINHDQYVILKATSTSNIKNLKVQIEANGDSKSESCQGNCTVSVRKDLYE